MSHSKLKETDLNMGNRKSVETVKAEDFNQSMLTDESFSFINFHSPSGFGGAAIVLGVVGLAGAGYAIARFRHKRREAARRRATTLEITKTP